MDDLMDFANQLQRGLSGSYSDRQRAILEVSHPLVASIQNGMLRVSEGSSASKNAATIALLTLSDTFRDSDNTLRIAVVKVFKAVAHLIHKEYQSNSIFKRIKVVLSSNDAVARALTLRLYGLLVHTVEDSIDIHHSIIEALESKHAFEYDAAVFAVDRSSETSMFSGEIVRKVARIVDKQGASISKKLIRVLSHMHRNTTAAMEAQILCFHILSLQPPPTTFHLTLKALTRLASRVPFQTPRLQTFLFEQMREVRNVNRVSILEVIEALAATSMPSGHGLRELMNMIWEAALDDDAWTRAAAFTALRAVAEGSILGPDAVLIHNRTPQLIEIVIEGGDGSVAACDLLCLMLVRMHGDPREFEMNNEVVKSIGDSLSRAQDRAVCVRLIRNLGNVAILCPVSAHLESALQIAIENKLARHVLAKALPELHTKVKSPLVFHSPFFITVLEAIQRSTCNEHEMDASVDIDLLAGALLFKSRNDNLMKEIEFVTAFNCNGWDLYRIAKGAMVGGHWEFATNILEKIALLVTSDISSKWIHTLRKCAHSFLILSRLMHGSDPMVLNECVNQCEESLEYLSSLASATSSRVFQRGFMNAITSYLSALLDYGQFARDPAPRFQIFALERFRQSCYDSASALEMLLSRFPDCDTASVACVKEIIASWSRVADQAPSHADVGCLQTVLSAASALSYFGFPAYFFLAESSVKVSLTTEPLLSEDKPLKVDSPFSRHVSCVVKGVVIVPEGWRRERRMRWHYVTASLFVGADLVSEERFREKVGESGIFSTTVTCRVPEIVSKEAHIWIESVFEDCQGRRWKLGDRHEGLLKVNQ
ncbi:hypothetical protein BC830DRAFT_1219990 [Chytriomyces sp. MP71]|nr:hypothetical protein BC830DRAFT_1219990 [Chytriomyces sp. MP71]